jgi:hypothetical protein|tara:strand:- start:543 stop:911 length:369 start_codon:yes stop_codon:yes gene_type:complete
MKSLSNQDMHNLAMNIVGESLKNDGFEFIQVNSKLKKDPQFVCTKNKKLFFIIVRAIKYPKDPEKYDFKLMSNILNHANKFKARTFYAGVGLANKNDFEKKLNNDSPFIVNYKGLKEISGNE